MSIKRRRARNWSGYCKKCAAYFEGYHRSQKFCCKKHRDSFNERRRKLERALVRKAVSHDLSKV